MVSIDAGLSLFVPKRVKYNRVNRASFGYIGFGYGSYEENLFDGEKKGRYD